MDRPAVAGWVATSLSVQHAYTKGLQDGEKDEYLPPYSAKGFWGIAVADTPFGPRPPVRWDGKPTTLSRNLPTLSPDQQAIFDAYDESWTAGHARIPFWKRKKRL